MRIHLPLIVLLTSYGSAEQSMKVTYQSFGVIGDGEKAQQFVDSIDATSEYSAKLWEDAHPKAGWRKIFPSLTAVAPSAAPLNSNSVLER